jgi:hypothetical protein
MKRLSFLLNRFILAYGIIMLGTFFMCLIFNPTSELPVVLFFGRCIVLTLVCMATLVVYYTKSEHTSLGWWLRTILHALLLEAVLLPLAHYWGFWYGKKDALIYASFILVAKIVWHVVDYGRSMRVANEVNEELLRRRIKQNENT